MSENYLESINFSLFLLFMNWGFQNFLGYTGRGDLVQFSQEKDYTDIDESKRFIIFDGKYLVLKIQKKHCF